MPTATVDGVQVAYEVEGAGDTVVLLHGTTQSRVGWALEAPTLAERWQVVRPELSGSGETVDGGGPLEVDGLVAQAVGVADAVGAERFHLAGYSLGAVVAATTAAFLPERVASLTLVCGWATTDARMRFTFDLWRRLLEADRELFARYTLADGLTAATFELLGDAVHDLVPPAAATFAAGSARQIAFDMGVDIADRLEAITAPTLVIGSREDRWVPVEHSRRLAAAIAGARLVELDAGHAVLSERPAEITALMTEHILKSSEPAG